MKFRIDVRKHVEVLTIQVLLIYLDLVLQGFEICLVMLFGC